MYKDEVFANAPQGLSTNDSSVFLNDKVTKWVEKQLLLQRAALNLPESMTQIEEQIENYRSSLLIYTYETELIKQKLDTIISETEIEEYYNQNLQNFELHDFILKLLYVKVEKSLPQISTLKKLLFSNDVNDKQKLDEFCRKYAQNFLLDDNIWLYYNDILKEIPFKTYNFDDFLRNNKFVELEDNDYYYFVLIKEYRLKNSVSPLELQKQNIKEIILNKRKLSLISTIRQELYREAVASNQIEYFYR